MNIILLSLIFVISLIILILCFLSGKKYKDVCGDDHQIVTYNNSILVGTLLIIILVTILFFINKNTVSKFSFG